MLFLDHTFNQIFRAWLSCLTMELRKLLRWRWRKWSNLWHFVCGNSSSLLLHSTHILFFSNQVQRLAWDGSSSILWWTTCGLRLWVFVFLLWATVDWLLAIFFKQFTMKTCITWESSTFNIAWSGDKNIVHSRREVRQEM